MSAKLLKTDLNKTIIQAVNNKIHELVKILLAGTNKYVDNYNYLNFKRNYHIENIRYIQLDYAFERIYITFFYEDYKQQTIMSLTHDKGYIEKMQEKAMEEYKEQSTKTIKIYINDKEVYKNKL